MPVDAPAAKPPMLNVRVGRVCWIGGRLLDVGEAIVVAARDYSEWMEPQDDASRKLAAEVLAERKAKAAAAADAAKAKKA